MHPTQSNGFPCRCEECEVERRKPVVKTFTVFMNEVADLSITMRWRKGQALFNLLDKEYPHIANSLRATPLDPYFQQEGSKVYKECVKFLKTNWTDLVSPPKEPKNDLLPPKD